MIEHQRQSSNRPRAKRYYPQYALLDADPGISREAALQEAVNEGSSQSWKLISVTKNPISEGFFLVWETSGFFSG